MVNRVLSTRGAAIPVQHYATILAVFVEEHQLFCCIGIVHGHVQYLSRKASSRSAATHLSRLCARARSCRFMCETVVGHDSKPFLDLVKMKSGILANSYIYIFNRISYQQFRTSYDRSRKRYATMCNVVLFPSLDTPRRNNAFHLSSGFHK